MSSKSYTKEEILESVRLCESKYGKATTTLMSDDENLIHPYYVKKRFGTFSNAKIESDIDNVGQIHLTNDELDQINNSITETQKEILKGLLMGDAWVGKEKGKSAELSMESINEEFIDWLDEVLGDIVSQTGKRNTASELAEKNRKYGYTVNEENYNDIYVLRTRRLPYFNKLNGWYSTGKKRFPKIKLSPTVLKMWYVCDGSFVDSRYPVIYSSNENDRKGFVLSLFDDINLNPSFTKSGGGAIQFKTSESRKFFNYIGEPVSGFEYKWPEEFK